MTNWKYHINIGDIWNNDDLSFEERRDAITARIKESIAYRRADRLVNAEANNGGGGEDYYYHEEFIDNVEYLGEAAEEDEFDSIWSYIYDYCDDQLIWIDTLEGPGE